MGKKDFMLTPELKEEYDKIYEKYASLLREAAVQFLVEDGDPLGFKLKRKELARKLERELFLNLD